MMLMRGVKLGLLAGLWLAPLSANAQENLEVIVQKAIQSNPGVLASWNAFQESVHAREVTAGGLLPSIDLNARVGHEQYDRAFGDDSYQPAETELSLRQLVFDGFATSNEIKRLDFDKLVRFYEVLQVSEETALEAVTAYADVLRYRQLLGFADESFYQHQQIFQQVKERADSGLGRGVDLEQATGRLALAHANRLTEVNNLHDVTARFLRIVGELPSQTIAPLPDFSSATFPTDAEMSLREALKSNPGFNAAVETVRVAEMARDARKSGFWPKVELRARYDTGSDREEIDGHSDAGVVELALNYNLFRGGSDRAAVLQHNSRLSRAKNLREKSCREVRQNMTIAYNEVGLLALQLDFLKAHMDSIANARHAYRKQFDLGQRTLLDLLDSENEFFRARRAYTVATYDSLLARARTLAGMGKLMKFLGVSRDDLPALSELGADAHGDDPLAVCPASAVPESLVSSATSDFAGIATTISTEVERDVDYDGDGVPLSLDKCPATPAGVRVDAEGCPEAVDGAEPVAPAAPESDLSGKPQAGVNLAVKMVEVHFSFDESSVPEQAYDDIAKMAALLEKHPEASLVLGGHTDTTGTDVYNLNLSRNRAESVRNRLVHIHGISPSRVFMTWYNSARPVADNATSEGRQQNRRVESYISLVLKGANLE